MSMMEKDEVRGSGLVVYGEPLPGQKPGGHDQLPASRGGPVENALAQPREGDALGDVDPKL